MNKLFACFALAFVAPIFSSLYAEEGQPPEPYEPPPPVGMDVDYFAPPKQKIFIGFRSLSGPKVSLSLSGRIPSSATPDADSTTTNRIYDDGFVGPDTRTDATTGAPINDGRTTNWRFANASQLDTAINGVDMHTYNTTINGTDRESGRTAGSRGVELTYERDFGWHLGKVQIDFIGGLSMNKISYSRTSNVAATMTTRTDAYNTYNTNLDGNGDPVKDANGNPTYTAGTPTAGNPAAPVVPPYQAPNTNTDSAGNSVDDSAIIGSEPVNPNPQFTQSQVQVVNQWDIAGGYFMLRAGAQATLPITDKFSASVSGGPALLYAGTTFTVEQTLTPPTGSASITQLSDSYNTVLPAYFADANIEYSLTDTTGFYLGAVFQSSSSYNQSIHSANENYTNKVDFGNEEGVRGGISFKF